MLKLGGKADLAFEALGAHGRRELGEQDVDGDVAVVLDVLGQLDRGHAAATKFLLELVAVADGRLEPRERVGGRRFLRGEATRRGRRDGRGADR